MAKGIPLMGRGPDGKAKIINVDENGNLKIQQVGTLGARQVIVQESAADWGVMTGLRVSRNPAFRVEVSNNGLYTFNTGLSFEMELYPITRRHSSLFCLFTSDGDQRSVKLQYYDTGDSYRLFVSEDGVDYARFDVAGAPFVPQKFTEIALTWEFGSNPVLYVNKTPYPMTLEYGTMPSSLFATSAPLCIGFDPDYTTSRNLNGLIRNIRLWKDVVRSHEQINQPITGNEPGLVGYWKADEGEGTILTDSSPNANHGTITNGSWESVSLGVLLPDRCCRFRL